MRDDSLRLEDVREAIVRIEKYAARRNIQTRSGLTL